MSQKKKAWNRSRLVQRPWVVIDELVSLFRGALVVVMVMANGRKNYEQSLSGVVEREEHASARERS